jgi:predicted MFS family arabinose efflux permease
MPTRITRLSLSAGTVLFSAMFAVQSPILVLSPILPQMAEDLGVSTAAAAQLRSVAGVTAGIVALVFAIHGSKLRLSVLLGAGLWLLAGGSLLTAVAPSYPVMLATHVVIGLGLAAVLAAGFAASEVWSSRGDKARALSRALIGQPVAWIVGQPIVGLVAAYHWRWAWVAIPLASSIVALVALRFRDDVIGDSGQECDPLGLWRTNGVKGWAISEFLAFSAWGGALVYAGAVFIEGHGVDVATTGLILGAGAILYLPGNSLSRRMIEVGPVRLMAGFALFAAVTIAVFVSTSTPLPLAVGGFGAAVFFAAGRSFAGAASGLQLSEGRRLAAMSVRASADQFGYLAGAVVGGVLLDIWGFVGAGIGFGVLMMASALVLLPDTVSRSDRLPDPRRFLRRAPVARRARS